MASPLRPTRLTATYIEGLKPRATRYEISDPAVPGLQLRVETTGAKHWQYRFYFGTTKSGERARQRMAFGTWPEGRAVGMTLEQARAEAFKAAELLDRGIDPRRGERVKRRGTRKVTDAAPLKLQPEQYASKRTPSPVEAAIERLGLTDALKDQHSIPFLMMEYLERHVRRRRRRPVQVEYHLAARVLPAWGTRDARTITPREVIELLDGIVDKGSPVSANRCASILGQMFRFGIHRQIVEATPVQLLHRPGGKEKPRERVLDDEELRYLMQHFESSARFQTGDAARSTRLMHALKILLLTGQRRAELANAMWQNVRMNDDPPRWFIPSPDTKTEVENIVPLTPAMIREFRALRKLAGSSPYVMPTTRGDGHVHPQVITRGLSRNFKRLAKLAAESDPPVTLKPFAPHDLRRTMRTNLSRLKVPSRVAEAILNHQLEGVEGVYDRYRPEEEMRAALELWERFLMNLKEGRKLTADDLRRQRKSKDAEKRDWRQKREAEKDAKRRRKETSEMS